MTTPAMRNWLLLILLLLLLQEFLFRFLFPLPQLRDFNRARYMPLGSSPARRATSVANLDLIWSSAPDQADFVHHLNAYGFRDKTWPLAKTPRFSRIAFIGDSYVEGLMAEDHETIPAAFGAAAAAAGQPVETMNFGFGGAGLAQEFQLILDIAPVFRPDAVCLIVFANDLPAAPIGLTPRPLRRYHAATPRVIELLRLWRERAMLPLRGRRPRAHFLAPVPDPDNPWSNPEYDRVMRRHVTPAIYDAMRAGRFNPSRVGGSFALAPVLQSPVDLRLALRGLRDALTAQGIALRVVYLPMRSQVTTAYAPFEAQLSQGLPAVDLTAPEYQRHAQALAAQCAELDLPFLDLTPTLRAAESANHRLYWNYDDHPRAAGYNVIAKVLLDWWRPS